MWYIQWKINIICFKKEENYNTCYKSWINFENMLTEISQLQKDMCCMISLK